MVGRVVVLNGVSSSGKTTIVDTFWARRNAAGELWMRTGIDDYIAQLGPALCAIPSHPAPRADVGFRIVDRDGTVQCEAGPVARRLFRAYHRTVATWAAAGLDVLVDECAFDRETMDDWADALIGVPSLWVAVRCDADVVDARERARGDRVIGLAAGQRVVVHAHREHDAVIDTTRTTPEDCVVALERAVAAFPWFSAGRS